MINHSSRPWCGQSLNMSLYLSQASKSDSLSFCLKPFIWALSIAILLGGKYRAKKTFFNSFQVVTELAGRDWSQALALSLNEKWKRRSLIALGLTPFALTVSAYCKNTDKCRLGSSVGLPENWFCCIAYNSEALSSKLFASIAGAAILLCGSYEGIA